jgi:hypothetical protein
MDVQLIKYRSSHGAADDRKAWAISEHIDRGRVDRAGPNHPNRYPQGVGEMHKPDALVTTPGRKKILVPFLQARWICWCPRSKAMVSAARPWAIMPTGSPGVRRRGPLMKAHPACVDFWSGLAWTAELFPVGRIAAGILLEAQELCTYVLSQGHAVGGIANRPQFRGRPIRHEFAQAQSGSRDTEKSR